jgi:hypothetical protein
MLDIRHPRLRQLYDYWDGKRGARSMPARADLDPVDFRFVIGDVVLADVIDGEPPRFRIRVHGSNLVDRVHCELTGKLLDEMPAPEFRDLVTRSFRKVVRTKAPLHVLAARPLDGRMQRYETIILPLSSDSKRVDRLMVGMIYEPLRR